MPVSGNFAAQTLEHPTGIAIRPEEYSPMVAVNSDDAETLSSEKDRNFGTN